MLVHNLAFYISAGAALVSVCLAIQGIAQTQETGEMVVLFEGFQGVLMKIMVGGFILGLVLLAFGV